MPHDASRCQPWRSLDPGRRAAYRRAIAVVLSMQLGAGIQAQTLDGGVVRAGDARITSDGVAARIDQTSDRAIIDWRSFGVAAGQQVVFVQPSAQSATLNRVTGGQASVILGRLDANGQVLLINPNGIVFGRGSQVNVASLIASTSNLTNDNFMSGRLVFDQPGRPGAGVLNAGTLTAAEGGLIALVAPHVRNDGVIVARLGRVTLGAADTFTIDLYGDGLINLALSDAHTGQLRELNGDAVTSLVADAGTIDVSGGRAVLMTARTAKNVLDNLINMSGAIKADTAVQQGGRILLLGEGGTVAVSGSLSASGSTGGAIDVLGGTVHLEGTALADASGAAGGGTVHVGGAFQGQGDTYRASQTSVDAGATLAANAVDRGNGGEVVVWSDGQTQFAGQVAARGGAQGGDGGRLEVSGKGTLDFRGGADASASDGRAGSLLLDPATIDIDAADAGVISRVLRTGTSTTLAADTDINVNSAILGGDRIAGGGLTLTAGNNINVNDFIITNDGAVRLAASRGTVNVAAGTAVYAGSAPITISAGGTLHTAPLVTTGALSLASTAGSVDVDSFIDGHTGPVSIGAAADVDLNQPIVSIANGTALEVTAGNDVNVNAQIDGRGGAAGGAVTMTAGRNVNVNESIVTNNGGLSLTAATGGLTVGDGRALVAGSGPLGIAARGDIVAGAASAGTLAITSSDGSVVLNGLIDSATGDARIAAGGDVTINQPILNGQTGGSLAVAAGRDVNVNAQVDGRGGTGGGAVALTAGRDVNVSESLATNNGGISIAAAGTAAIASDKGLFAGSAPIAMQAGGDVTTGAASGGSFSAASSGGAVNVDGVIDGSTGRVDLRAAGDVQINQPILSVRSGNPLTVTAGRDILVNAPIDGRGGAAGGSASLSAAHSVSVNDAIVTNGGDIGITAAGGGVTLTAPLVATGAPIAITARGDVTTVGISGGSLAATSTTGAVLVNGVIDGSTGRVDLSGAGDVTINQSVLSLASGAAFSATAGHDLTVNAQIDGSSGAAGGAATLAAGHDVNVNAPVTTHDAAIAVSASTGSANIAPNAGLFAGTGAISVDALGSVNTGVLTGGPISVTSRNGSVAVTGAVAGSGGAIDIAAAGQVDVAHSIANAGGASPLTITAGSDITVNAQIDGRSSPGVLSGAVTLAAGGNVVLNHGIDTADAAITVTADAGAVTTAADAGLFAGSGPIRVQSGQTFSTPTTSTTGALSLRSTGGSVNVANEISGATGPVTISAAADVNVNQSISFERSDAPLAITAGHDINVDAAIYDPLLTGSSGTATLTAANDVALNQNIVSHDSAVTVTAQDGAITWATGKGLFAGTGTISATSSATLNTGIASTTGALNLRSTGGDVNVDTAIGNATGAVSITAGNAVNVNQTITNLKTGNDLSITAGTDINVLASIDGRSGVAGGRATLTAGNDLNLADSIATNNGAVNLTATNGSVTMPAGVESALMPMQWIVSAGSAPVSITSGGDFTLASPVNTTGALSITSTGGNVDIAAPITDDTGAVTVTAANALTVNHQVKSANQPITLNAGAGGLTVNTINDFDETELAPVNSGTADLTLNSVGNVSIADPRGIASTGTVTIDTRGQILSGWIGDASGLGSRPAAVVLNADGGITAFSTGFADSVTAASSGGTISMTVGGPVTLRITTGTPGTTDCPTCDINLNSNELDNIGSDVVLNAGGSVNLADAVGGTLDITARTSDVNLSLVNASSLTATAGRDVSFSNMLWVRSGGVTLTAGRDVVTTPVSPIHITGGETLTLNAGRNITLNELESLGAVDMTAATGNVTLNNDVGPHIVNNTSEADFNPTDLGVASLSILAPSSTAAVTMQGARAEGDVTITTGGSLTAAKEITSVAGTLSITTGGTQSIAAVPIGDQDQLLFTPAVSPVASPGPRQPLPTAPGFSSAGNAGVPLFGEIPVAAADQVIASVNVPGAGSGAIAVASLSAAAAAPNGASRFTSVSGAPSGPAVALAAGSPDASANGDPASALRSAEQSCDETASQKRDTGLDAVRAEKSAAQGNQKNAACGATTETASNAASPAAGSTTDATPAIRFRISNWWLPVAATRTGARLGWNAAAYVQ